MRDGLFVFFEVLDLLHYLAKHFWAILRWIPILDKANLDFELELITYILVVEPVSKGRFCVDNFLHLFSKHFALVIDDNAVK